MTDDAKLPSRYELDILVARYKKSSHRDDERLRTLDVFGISAFLWQLHTCQFEIVPFSETGFCRYVYTDRSGTSIDIMNYVANQEISKLIDNFLN